MSWDVWQTLLRTVLKAGAGALIARGVLQSDEANELVGAIVLLCGVIWGIFHRSGGSAKTPPAVTILFLILLCGLLSGCAISHYTHTTSDGSKTEYYLSTCFSTSSAKGLVVDGNGTNRDSAGLRMTGIATDPNSASITASGDALGTLIGTSIGKGIQSAVKP